MHYLFLLLTFAFSLDGHARVMTSYIAVQSVSECGLVATNDRRWTRLDADSIKPKGRYCLRVPVERPRTTLLLPTLKVSMLGAYHLYWNGRYLASNGIPADTETGERPGRLGSLHPLLPPHEVRDSNTLLISVSTQHLTPRVGRLLHDVRIDDYQALVRQPLFESLPLVASSGAMVLMALYMLMVHALERTRVSHLVFSLLCGLLALMLVTELWRDLFSYPYDRHVVRIRAILALSFAIALLLPCYYVLFYQRRVRPSLGAAGAIILVASAQGFDSYGLGCFAMLMLGIAASLLICISAWRARLPFSGINLMALSALAFPVLVNPETYTDRALFLMFPVLAIALLLTLSLEHHQQRRHALRAVRLEVDLLRQSLQPHFLMNSLTMVMEWIEQNPPKAIGFIDALADEFRQLNACADKRLIPLSMELQLCRSYLAMMGYRKGRSFNLDSRGVDPSLPVPPAMLHTLVENAFSHNRLDFNATFTLTQYQLPDAIMLRFDCPYDGDAHHDGGGLGLAYIRARLDDAFGRHWKVHHHCGGDVWRTEITIASKEPACAS
jgi:hypothetical protein